MKKIRIGNDIEVLWQIYDSEGEAYDLTGKDITVEMIVRDAESETNSKVIPVENYSRGTNNILFTFYGKDQTYLGEYYVKLCENGGKTGMKTLDMKEAFCLVPHSWQAGGEDSSMAVIPTTINIDGRITTGLRGESAYEVAVENGYIGTVQEWLTDPVNGIKGEKGDKGDKGDTGNSGYSGAAGELEVVNNLTDGGETAALSAEMGKTLKMAVDTKVNINTKNLIDESVTPTAGMYYKYSTGAISYGTNFSIYPLIPVEPSTNYHLSCIRNGSESYIGSGSNDVGICFYSGNSVSSYISAVKSNVTTFTTPATAKYIGISCYGSFTKPCLNKGNSRFYSPYNQISGYLDDGIISTSAIQDESVTEEKISQQYSKKYVLKNSANIIDWDNATPIEDRYYKGSTGALAYATGDRTYMALPLVPVKSNTQYYLSCLRSGVEEAVGYSTEIATCFYTSASVFISSVSGATMSFTTPSTAAFIGISLYNYDSVTKPCFQEGSSRKYSKYNPISGYVADDIIPEKSISTEEIKEGAVVESKTVFFEQTKNLFDYTAVTRGKYIGATGLEGTNSSYAVSDYIPIDSSNSYLVSNHYGTSGAFNTFYTSSKTFISNFQQVPVAIPSTAAFVRISIYYNGNESILKETQVEYGQQATSYVPFGYSLKEKYISNIEKQSVSMPNKLYVLSDVNFDIFYEPVVRYWNPYRYDVKAETINPGRNYVKAIKRVCTLNNPTTNSLTLSVYDSEKETVVASKTCTLVKGNRATGSDTIKLGIIGDSYTDGGCFTPALLSQGNVPHLQMVGTRSVNTSNYINQRLDGRSGWALSSFFSIQTGADYFNPFYHPQGEHRYWGNTAFWKNVCGGNPTGYSTRYAHYASLCDSNGWPMNPVDGDVIYDSINSVFKEYQNQSWGQVAATVAAVKEYYTWEFSYLKYLNMWNIEMADIFCVYLGVNDYWVLNEPTDESLATWKSRVDSIISSYHSVNATGKFVILGPNTVTYPNVNHYQPLDVHRRMWKLRDFIFSNYDLREAELIYVVDTAHLIDSNNSYTLNETIPFDWYPNGHGYSNKEVWTGDGQHPRVSYTTLGYSLAGFIQYIRQ